ncbi:hypothetical protein BBJ28_00011236 [Nothophytophthora sp. Chile5]|nr:hypothetical protein BBJ28_00011236 [Nothophytophthora sp. Chile5]
MLRAPTSLSGRREASAPSSPASAHALLSLMQSVAPQAPPPPLELDASRANPEWWQQTQDQREEASQHQRQPPERQHPASPVGETSSSSSLMSSPAAEGGGGSEQEGEKRAVEVQETRGSGTNEAKQSKPRLGRGPAAKPKKSKEHTQKPKKVRKRTYYMRKEELGELTEEMAKLEAQMAFYKRRNDVLEARDSLLRREAQSRAMRQAIHAQRLAFANTQSMIAQYMRLQEHSPFETFIQLGKDPVERHATLLSIKNHKLHDALQFLVARRRFMDASTAFSDHQKFENAHGDFCSMGFDVTPFVGVRSARTVFDVLLNFSYNLEISLSELMGDITVRENDDHWDPSVSQQRLVTNVANVVQMETNNVMFSEYLEQGGPAGFGVELPHEADDLGALGHGQDLGVLACDFVNEDEQFPYLPGRRIRQDVTVLMMVSTCMKPKASTREQQTQTGNEGQVEMERVVVLTRWSLLRIRKSSLQIPSDVTHRIRQGIEQVGEAMLNNVRYALVPRAVSAPPTGMSTATAPVSPTMAVMLSPTAPYEPSPSLPRRF